MPFCGGRAAAPFGSMCRAQRSLCVSIYSAKKNRHRFCSACSVWGGRWDSNPRSSVPQTDALGQLRYTHHILARLKGLEPLAPCLEGRCSIQLSYRRLLIPQGHKQLERVMGIEPTRPAWKAGVLPLNYTRTWAALTALSIIPQGLRNVKKNFRIFAFSSFFFVGDFRCRFVVQRCGLNREERGRGSAGKQSKMGRRPPFSSGQAHFFINRAFFRKKCLTNEKLGCIIDL